jgi:2-polyprenyl-6-methoxyphenol hydroxylase-like FAD-dependent oxidoreductase
MAIETKDLPVLVSGGGIGGLAAALALVRQGFQVQVFEQSPEIGEIGAGIQLGPNAFHAFDALGVGDKARGRAVYTDYMVMHDAIDETLVGKIETGEAFRKRFGNPYAVIHRVDIHPRCSKARWKPAAWSSSPTPASRRSSRTRPARPSPPSTRTASAGWARR